MAYYMYNDYLGYRGEDDCFSLNYKPEEFDLGMKTEGDSFFTDILDLNQLDLSTQERSSTVPSSSKDKEFSWWNDTGDSNSSNRYKNNNSSPSSCSWNGSTSSNNNNSSPSSCSWNGSTSFNLNNTGTSPSSSSWNGSISSNNNNSSPSSCSWNGSTSSNNNNTSPSSSSWNGSVSSNDNNSTPSSPSWNCSTSSNNNNSTPSSAIWNLPQTPPTEDDDSETLHGDLTLASCFSDFPDVQVTDDILNNLLIPTNIGTASSPIYEYHDPLLHDIESDEIDSPYETNELRSDVVAFKFGNTSMPQSESMMVNTISSRGASDFPFELALEPSPLEIPHLEIPVNSEIYSFTPIGITPSPPTPSPPPPPPQPKVKNYLSNFYSRVQKAVRLDHDYCSQGPEPISLKTIRRVIPTKIIKVEPTKNTRKKKEINKNIKTAQSLTPRFRPRFEVLQPINSNINHTLNQINTTTIKFIGKKGHNNTTIIFKKPTKPLPLPKKRNCVKKENKSSKKSTMSEAKKLEHNKKERDRRQHLKASYKLLWELMDTKEGFHHLGLVNQNSSGIKQTASNKKVLDFGKDYIRYINRYSSLHKHLRSKNKMLSKLLKHQGIPKKQFKETLKTVSY